MSVSELEFRVFPKQVREYACVVGVVIDEYSDSPECAKETADIRNTFGDGPVPNFSNSGVVGNAPFICTFVSNNDGLGDTEKGLFSRECAAGMFNTLYDAVDVQRVFPNKSANARILRDCLISAIG